MDFKQCQGSEEIDDIVRGFLAIQTKAALHESRPLCRGIHAKGLCVRGVFEVLDIHDLYEPALATRLAQGVYATPGHFPATARFSSSSAEIDSDWVPDLRGLAISVDAITCTASNGTSRTVRQDYSMQTAPTLAFNDLRAFVVFGRVAAARSETVALASLSHNDQLVYVQTKAAILQQKRQTACPFQTSRYWSTVPFRHGPREVMKYSAMPVSTNSAHALDPANRNALVDELARHLNDDVVSSSFDFAVQLLDIDTMKHAGSRRSAGFWIDNAAVEWPEVQAPFRTVARLHLLARSVLAAKESEQAYFDVTEYSTLDTAPIGPISQARQCVEHASHMARRASREGTSPAAVVERGDCPIHTEVMR